MFEHLPPPRVGSPIVRWAVLTYLAVSMVAAPSLALSQPVQKVFRVGYLAIGGRTSDGAPPAQLREALRSLGYVEGKNVHYEARFAEGRIDQLPGLAAGLVRLKADIIANGGPATLAGKQATSTIRS